MGEPLRVLVGCEESGVVRRAFRSRGHEAWSCDLIPARDGGEHLQMCVREAITKHGPWDLIILHIDCTAMAVSGNGTYGRGKKKHHERLAQIEWAIETWSLAKKHARVGAAFENPVSMIWRHVGKPQYIQPWQFGHGETKKTGILTDRLPPLEPTNIVSGRAPRVWKMAPGPNRKRDRSETYTGIGEAMADRWGNLQRMAA